MPRSTIALRSCPVPLVLASESDPVSRPRSADGLVRVRHRVYAETSSFEALPPWSRYLARVHAVALVRPRSIFCLESAAALLGMPVFGEPRDIHVFDPLSSTSTRFGDVAVHTSADPRGLLTIGGIRLTMPGDTAIDLLRVLPPAFGLAAVDAVIAPRQLGLLTGDELAEVAAGQSARRGSRLVAWGLAHADPRSESVGEGISRAVIDWLGFPAPVLQQEFDFEGSRDRSDFFWPEYGTVGESDGFGKYDLADPESSRRRMLAEKRREDRLRRHLRGFARWEWSDALRAGPLRDKLLRAGVPLVRPPRSGLLATLARHPRSLPRRENARAA